MKKTKRLIALVLCAVMWLGCMGPVSASAENHEHEHDAEAEAASAASAVSVEFVPDADDHSVYKDRYIFCCSPTVKVTSVAGHTVSSVTVNGEEVGNRAEFKLPEKYSIKLVVIYDGDAELSYTVSVGHFLGGRRDVTYPEKSCISTNSAYICAHCGEPFELGASGEANHNFKEVKTVQSCDGKTYEVKKCSDCGRVFTEEKAGEPSTGTAVEHDWHEVVIVAAEDADCTQDGVSYMECTKCGMVSGQKITYGTHKLTNVEYIEPTCRSGGKTSGTCSVCGEKIEYTIPRTQLSHDWGEWKVTTQPTCISDGERERTCTVCGAKETGTMPKSGHKPDYPSDCTEKDVVCSLCGVVISEKKAGHTYSVYDPGRATETTHTKVCASEGCEAFIEEEHNFYPYQEKVGGPTVYKCACGYVRGACAHKYVLLKDHADADGHEMQCSKCGDVKKVAHTKPKKGTGLDCTKGIECTVCGYIITAPKKEHRLAYEVPSLADYHIGYCLDCDYRGEETKCTPVEGSDRADCTKGFYCVCGRWMAHGYDAHKLGKRGYDENTHWRECENPGCKQRANEEPHNFKVSGDCKKEVCTVCGYEREYDEPHHQWGPTKDNHDGTHSRTCSNCGTVEVSKKHDFSNWLKNDESTHVRHCVCGASEKAPHKWKTGDDTGDGEHHESICEDCGEVKTEAHAWGAWTATADGHERTCDCGAVEKEDHTYGDWNVTDDGHERKCSVCGAVDKGEHTYGDWDVTDDGHERKCSVCGDVEKGEHTYGDWDVTDDRHERTCGVCGAVDKGEHTYGDWDVTKDGHERKCSVCGDVEKGEHTYGDWDVTKDGHERKCSVCGAVDKGEHTYGDWADGKDGENHVHVCSVCGAKATEEHDFKGGACTVCGAEDPNYVPPTTDTTGDDTTSTDPGSGTVPPQTGDGASVTVWLVILAVSAFGTAAGILVSKKRKA